VRSSAGVHGHPTAGGDHHAAAGRRRPPAAAWAGPEDAALIGTESEVAKLDRTALLWLLDRQRPEDAGWIDGTLGRADPETTAGRFATALRDRRAWGIGAIAGGSIFVVLYTSMFSNIGGLGTGTFGAVGYWLGQHDVQRGDLQAYSIDKPPLITTFAIVRRREMRGSWLINELAETVRKTLRAQIASGEWQGVHRVPAGSKT
jgi:hypothetical protein